jgi:hypothetical protein
VSEGRNATEALTRLRLLRLIGLATTLVLAILLYLATDDEGRLLIALVVGGVVSLTVPWLQRLVIQGKLGYRYT